MISTGARSTSSGRVVVVGSCNLDHVLVGQGFPEPGATVSADRYHEEAGGKGLNQAVAAGRMGARVSIVGAVGEDAAGAALRAVLAGAGVDTRLLRTTGGSSGRAVVFVDEQRDNRIVVVAGANASVTALTAADRELVQGADVLLLQLELPQPVAVEAAEAARDAGVPVYLTPAPVQPLDPRLLAATSVLFANEPEACAIAGTAHAQAAAELLLELVPAVVVTRGERGSDYADRTGLRLHRDALPVTPVDTTAAGDTYVGTFAAFRTAGASVEEALERATAAAALAVQRPGTSSAVPTASELPPPAL